MSLSFNLYSNSDLRTELNVGKLMEISGIGLVNLSVNLMTTSVGIFLLNDGFSNKTEGLASVLYTASMFKVAFKGSPSQEIDPPFFTENFLSIIPPYLKLYTPS